MPTAEEAMFEA